MKKQSRTFFPVVLLFFVLSLCLFSFPSNARATHCSRGNCRIGANRVAVFPFRFVRHFRLVSRCSK